MSFNSKQERKKRSIGGSRKIKEVVCAYCEGQTEFLYLDFLRTRLKLSNFQVKPIELKKKGSPLILAQKAVSLKRESKKQYDSYYLVYDKDKSGNEAHFEEAQRILKKNQIISCHSFPSIEFWLLLYFQDLGEALLDNEVIIEKLNNYLPVKYSKEKNVLLKVFEYIYPNINQAVERAKKIEQSPVTCYSLLYILIEKILDSSKKK